jgi:RNA-directed DNA polymerase
VEWNNVNWRKLEKRVFKLQKRIYSARKRGDYRAVRRLQKTLMKSWSARMLAVRKIAQENKGKKTAGVDGIKNINAWNRPKLAEQLKVYKQAKPTRRVWIPKPGKRGKRPLGIPTIYDRALQTLVKLALEPEWEALFEPNSYGFKPGRSGHDAIAAIYTAINRKPKWVFDADIAQCFDRIDHEKLIGKLNTYPTMRRLIKSWLKAGCLEEGRFQETEKGTPQGGAISPLLANIALHGMEEKVNEYILSLPGKKTNNLRKIATIRYADDFVIIHPDKETLLQCVQKVKEFLKELGLELKPEKTRLTHTLEEENPGFDFLGFNIRQYKVSKYNAKNGFKTLIKPSKDAIKRHIDKMKGIIENRKSSNQGALIKDLNPIIRGWRNYYRAVVSADIFHKIDDWLFKKLMSWTKRRYGNRSLKKKIRKTWRTIGENNWRFSDGTNHLAEHGAAEIVRHIKVQGDRSPYDGDSTYWSIRMGKHPEMPNQKAKLLKKQNGRCNLCGLTFRDGDFLEVHHIVHKAKGGNNKINNLELLHLHCHDRKHGTNDNGFQTEEPDEGKLSRPVLKERWD